MATIKSFTDLNQSKVLSKILPHESADMFIFYKSALVAEIKRLLDKYISVHTFNYGATQDLNHLLSFLDTLEVKEVDLDFQRFAKEMEIVFALPSSKTKNTEEEPLNWEYAIAKHFFELGMAVSNKAQKEKRNERLV